MPGGSALRERNKGGHKITFCVTMAMLTAYRLLTMPCGRTSSAQAQLRYYTYYSYAYPMPDPMPCLLYYTYTYRYTYYCYACYRMWSYASGPILTRIHLLELRAGAGESVLSHGDSRRELSTLAVGRGN